MNVLETAKILLRDYPVEHISYEEIQTGKGRTPYVFGFKNNNIEYRVSFEYQYLLDSPCTKIFTNKLRISICHKQYITDFVYKCNDFEKMDLMGYMHEAEGKYYNNFIKDIAVQPRELCNTIDPNAVDVPINPDMME